MAAELSKRKLSRDILVVDDEEPVRRACAQLLASCTVDTAVNGEEALVKLSSRSYDMVLADVEMPILGGIEMLESLQDMCPDVPVVIMTGHTDRETAVRALKAGASDIIYKPIYADELRTVVNKAIERRRLREQLAVQQGINQEKTLFIAMVSHKFKTPITTLSLMLQTLERSELIASDPEFQQHVHDVVSHYQQVEQMVDTLVRYNRLQTNHHESKPELVEIFKIFDHAVRDATARASRRNIQIRASSARISHTFYLDREQIVIALEALLENAIKFSPKGSEISCFLQAEAGGGCIRIEDQGPGIPLAERARVLEMGYQIDPDKTGQVPGLGMGLFFARQMVQANGGRLQLEEAPGGGLAASIILPAAY